MHTPTHHFSASLMALKAHRQNIQLKEHIIRQQNSHLQLMTIQADTLFVSDKAGRLRYHGEPGYQDAELDQAPRFFMGRTNEGNLWRFRYDLPDDVVSTLERLCRAEPTPADFTAAPVQAAEVRSVLEAHAPIRTETRGPAYWIPNCLVPHGDVEVALVSETNKTVLEAHFPWMLTARSRYKLGPVAVAVVEGKAVSMCHCARLTGAAAEAGVETVEAVRGHGYASAVVAVWAGAVREHGLIPLYSTSWHNKASQGVAQKLGMVPYGDDWSIT